MKILIGNEQWILTTKHDHIRNAILISPI